MDCTFRRQCRRGTLLSGARAFLQERVAKPVVTNSPLDCPAKPDVYVRVATKSVSSCGLIGRLSNYSKMSLHRQVVFSLPKRLRIFFRYDRKLLGELAGCAWRALRLYFQVYFDRDDIIPGAIGFIATTGKMLNFNPVWSINSNALP